MTYDLSGVDNTTGATFLTRFNEAANFWPVTGFVIMISVMVFVLVRRDHDAPEALMAASVMQLLLSAVLLKANLVGSTLFYISLAMAAFSLALHYWRGQPHST